MENKEIFSTRLKETRLQAGKSQKEFADMVQSTAATISAYENATKNPSLEIVINIARKCNISIDWLCGLKDDKDIKPTITNYKDVATRILELANLEILPYSFILQEYKIDVTDYSRSLLGESEYIYEWALTLPKEEALSKFVSTYEELLKLFKDSRIAHDVIDTWLNGALKDLEKMPIALEESCDELPFDIEEPPEK